MKAKDFSAWVAHMAWNDSEVARQLDISRNTVAKYKEEGAPVSIGLACAALAANLAEWQDNPPRPLTVDDLVWMVVRQLVAMKAPLSLKYISDALSPYPKEEVEQALWQLSNSRFVKSSPHSVFFTLTEDGMARLASGGS